MRRFRRGAIALSVASALAFAVTGSVVSAGASVSHAAGKPVAGGTVNLQFSPSTMDPGTSSTQQSSAPLFSLEYGQLYRDNPKGALSNDIAQGFVVSADGLTVTIPIRHGVSFQDGTPLNAAAVEYNLNRDEHGDGLGICPCSTFLAPIKSMSTKGAYTLVIHLSHRDTLLQDILAQSDATYMVSPTALQKDISAGNEAAFGGAPVGAGPYRLTTFVASTSGTFTKFAKSYEAKTVYIQTISYQKIAADATWIQDCQAQSVTVCSFSEANVATDSAQLAASVPALMYEVDSPRVYWTRVQFNVTIPPFNNPIAREAISEATDPSQLLPIVDGKPSVTCGLIASGNEFYWGSSCPKGTTWSYNPSGAAALVASLPGGTLKFSIDSIDNTTVYSQILPALAKEWAAIPGVTVTQNIISHATELVAQGNCSYNVIAPGPGGGFIDPTLGAQPYIGSGSPQNACGYKSAALDALLTRVETAKSPAQAASLWEAYNALDLNNYGDIGLYQGTTQNYINNALQGVTFSGYDVYYDHAWCKGGVCTTA
jgi:ABC-type transport system substrate-binding protein